MSGNCPIHTIYTLFTLFSHYSSKGENKMRSSRNARQKAVAIFLVIMLVLTCIKTEAIKYVFADEVSEEVSGIHTATDADAEYHFVPQGQ